MPFKGLAAPKRRLAPLLSLTERRGLARAMLSDVLAALGRAPGFSRVLVVSRDPAALELAAGLAAEPLLERGQAGYSAAAEQAAAAARRGGAAGLLVLPADLPLITPADLAQVLIASERAAVVLVPAADGRGTNALLTRPPGAIRYCYGADSFRSHRREAERVGLAAEALALPNLELDLDHPADVQRLLSRAEPRPATATWRYLTEIRLVERL